MSLLGTPHVGRREARRARHPADVMEAPQGQLRHRVTRALAVSHGVLVGAIWGYLAVRGVLNFFPAYDFVSYGLPFALMRVGATTFKPFPMQLAKYEGFPPLPDWVAGALILLTGRLSTACGIGVLGLAVALAGVRVLWGPGLSLRWYLTAVTALPLVVIHTNTGSVDLWAGAAVLLAFVALTRILAGDVERPALVCFCLGLAMAMLSKFTVWPFCVVLGATLVSFLAYRAYRAAAHTPTRAELLLYAALTLVILTAFPVRNLAKFGNPTYPFQPPLLRQRLPGVVATAEPWLWRSNTPVYLRKSWRPRLFVESAFELTRWRTTEPLVWNPTQLFDRKSPHLRMGGWFVGTVVGMCVLLVAAAVYDPKRRPAHAVFLLMVLLLLGLTQNHELRYWLFIPLTGLFLGVVALPSMPRVLRAGAKGYVLLVAAYVLWQTAPPPTSRFARAEEFIPVAAKRYWATHEPWLPGSTWPCIGAMSRALFWAGPTLREYRVQPCLPWDGRDCENPAAPPPCAPPLSVSFPIVPRANPRSDVAAPHGVEKVVRLSPQIEKLDLEH